LVANASSPTAGLTVDKSVEFSYEELSKATNDFSIASKIGQGGYGSVYYAELRGEVSWISFFLLWLLENLQMASNIFYIYNMSHAHIPLSANSKKMLAS
jgi:hypothetical protein